MPDTRRLADPTFRSPAREEVAAPADDEAAQRFSGNLPLERMHAALDGDHIVGGAGAFPFELTVPGGGTVVHNGVGPSDPMDALLAAYDRAGQPARVVFVLDHSTSMAGPRLAGLREAFATLSRAGGFDRFRVGEAVVLVRFAGTVLEERTVVIRGAADLARFTLSYATLGKSFPAFAIAKDIPEYDRVSRSGTRPEVLGRDTAADRSDVGASGSDCRRRQ